LVSTPRRDVAVIAANPDRRDKHPGSSHLIKRKTIELGPNASAGMIRMDGIQANLSNPLVGIEGERHETDNVVVDQGDVDSVMRFRVTHARQVLGLFGISPCQRESRYCLTDNAPEGAKYRLEGECAYSLNLVQIGGLERSDGYIRRHWIRLSQQSPW
jgi:hypothetical protein